MIIISSDVIRMRPRDAVYAALWRRSGVATAFSIQYHFTRCVKAPCGTAPPAAHRTCRLRDEAERGGADLSGYIALFCSTAPPVWLSIVWNNCDAVSHRIAIVFQCRTVWPRSKAACTRCVAAAARRRSDVGGSSYIEISVTHNALRTAPDLPQPSRRRGEG
jgi:hypothetical protein